MHNVNPGDYFTNALPAYGDLANQALGIRAQIPIEGGVSSVLTDLMAGKKYSFEHGTGRPTWPPVCPCRPAPAQVPHT